MSDPVTITLNGRAVEAAAGEMLIAVADREGVPIPRFCYHPKLSVAANCRMCLVEVSGARGPVPACATPVVDGMEVQTRSEFAREAQRATMEFLLINHPLDCPICDQGGECELQDLALEYGSDISRYSEARRVVLDPDLGPLVSTDMTRCIHCTRCVRFTEEIAGEQELGAFGRGEFMKIGTYVQRAMNSELSGCVIDLCPVGALNARPSRMNARAWELDDHPGLGEHDGVGSRLSRHTLRGRQIRCVPLVEETINESWLSDRDRFSYQAASHPDRLCWPLARHRDSWVRVSWEEALDRAAEALTKPGEKAGLIHPSSTVEECFRFQQLLRRCGARTVEHRARMSDFRGGVQYPQTPTLGCAVDRIAESDVIVLLGSFLRHDQPILNHRLRQAANSGTEVWIINPASFNWNFPPTQQAVLSPRKWLTLLHAMERSPAVAGREGGGTRFSDQLAQRLREAENALFWLGPLALNHPDASLLYASARNLCERTGARLGTLPEGANAPGAWLTGCVAHRGPGGMAEDGVDLSARQQEPPDLWVFYGVDPACDVADPARLRRVLAAARTTIGFHSFIPDPRHLPYDLLLPIPTVGERSGHLINLEGRWQSMTAAVPPPGEVKDGAEALVELLRATGHAPGFEGASLVAHCRGLEGRVVVTRKPPRDGKRLPDKGLLRVGAPSIYQQDPVSRHAHALQQAELAKDLVLRLHPETLRRHGLKNATHARLSQDGEILRLPLVADPQMPRDCVYLATGDARLGLLGNAFGVVDLHHA